MREIRNRKKRGEKWNVNGGVNVKGTDIEKPVLKHRMEMS